jgi:hypothetical protein
MMVRLFRANSLEAVWADGYELGDWVTAECPHCCRPQRYKNFALGWGKAVVVCRDCMSGFFLSCRTRRVAQRTLARLTPEKPWVFRAVRAAQRARAKLKSNTR